MKSFRIYLEEGIKTLSVYHGSGSSFEKFDQKKARIPNDFYGGGVAYFTGERSVGIDYAKAMSKKTGTPFLFTCTLKLRNMFDVDTVFTGSDLKEILPKNVEDFARGAGLLSGDVDKYRQTALLSMGKLSLTGDEVFKGLSKGMNNTADARKFLISKGYDGLRYNGGLNMNMRTKHDVYLAYNAKDIKINHIEKL